MTFTVRKVSRDLYCNNIIKFRTTIQSLKPMADLIEYDREYSRQHITNIIFLRRVSSMNAIKM